MNIIVDFSADGDTPVKMESSGSNSAPKVASAGNPAPRPLPPRRKTPGTKSGKASAKNVVVRSNFPETWIWTDDIIEYDLFPFLPSPSYDQAPSRATIVGLEGFWDTHCLCKAFVGYN
eukprot:gene10197-11245_t